MEAAACAHTKSFLSRGKHNQEMVVRSSWKAGEKRESQRTEEKEEGEGEMMIPVPLRGRSRCHQPCYRPEPPQHEQAPWPSDRICSCPLTDGCHPDTAARTHPSHLGHFLEEGRNRELHQY